MAVFTLYGVCLNIFDLLIMLVTVRDRTTQQLLVTFGTIYGVKYPQMYSNALLWTVILSSILHTIIIMDYDGFFRCKTIINSIFSLMILYVTTIMCLVFLYWVRVFNSNKSNNSNINSGNNVNNNTMFRSIVQALGNHIFCDLFCFLYYQILCFCFCFFSFNFFFFSCARMNPKSNRRHTRLKLYLKHLIHVLFIAILVILSLYASGQRTGIVLDADDCISQAVPIYEGYCLPHAGLRSDLADRDLTESLQKISSKHGDSFATTKEKEVVRYIEENLSYVPSQYDNELQNGLE